jgi:amidase
VAFIEPDTEVVFETLDSWAGALTRPDDIHTVNHSSDRANPATGPVYIIGAEPGDMLLATIIRITPLPPIISKIVPSGGLLAGEVASPYCHFVCIEGQEIVFPWGTRIPLRPMIGVIGTAPAKRPFPTLFPGDHGGNMDHGDITTGTTVYLPVAVRGALLAIGDVHASMGDGEVSGAGLDCPAEVLARISVAKGVGIQRPLLETSTMWMTCASASNLQEAVRVATKDMVEFLSRRLNISIEDAYLLASAAGDVRIGQACGSTVDSTARMCFPKVAVPQH